jgi:tetratricopeptide (TPR) repeat protein
MRYRIVKFVFCILFSSFLFQAVFAQSGKITADLEKDKPAKFKTKTLKSEKTGEKKFTVPRRIIQNTVSHYNYYFNANNKINQVIERARLNNNDVYYKLLPFYSYSLSNTSSQANELDSVIYKATAGILLHDLRSEWVDNFYLLIGKAYLLKKAFDSASMAFQFINFNLYPKKKKDEDQVIVGSNLNGGNSLSIANKETGNLLTKTFSKPPSRNDALVWQIRTLIEMEEYADAAGLLNTLHNDANFPGRLMPYLEEVNAYWFYKQGIYDSAATHLEKALSNANDLPERARSEYLLAQLYELTKNRTKASEYYNKAIRHATDPLLDIYAHLSNAKMYDSTGENQIDKSIGI